MFCPPDSFGGRHFCTNVHGVHWMIGTIFVKFSDLILIKSIKIVVTKCQILKLKCTKFNFGWRSAPDPLAGFKGPTSKGRERERREERGPLYFFAADLQSCTREALSLR